VHKGEGGIALAAVLGCRGSYVHHVVAAAWQPVEVELTQELLRLIVHHRGQLLLHRHRPQIRGGRASPALSHLQVMQLLVLVLLLPPHPQVLLLMTVRLLWS
jgi:hypothetical protein